MRDDDDHIILWLCIFGACVFILALMIWGWKPQPVIPLAYGEEPCIRTTLSEYTRNYPPQGATMKRRPSNWQVCTPQEILVPE